MNKYFLLGLIFMLVFSRCTEHDDIRQTIGNSNTFRIQAAHFSVSLMKIRYVNWMLIFLTKESLSKNMKI